VAEMQSADIFVLSGFMEGLPVVPMEAMACAVAVVAPCVAGIPELPPMGKQGCCFRRATGPISDRNWLPC
jgi:colanic acid/amylovoran biosynthesis glycosyltransferase